MKNILLTFTLLYLPVWHFGQVSIKNATLLKESGQFKEALVQLHVLKDHSSNVTKAKAFQLSGEIHLEQSNYQKAIDELLFAENLWKKLNKGGKERIRIYGTLASIYGEVGDVEKAHTYLQQQIDAATRVYGSQHELVGDAHLKMTKIGYMLGDWPLAQTSGERALTIFKASLPPNHIKIANAYNNAGLSYELGSQDYQKALNYYQKALKIKRLKLGDEHPSTNKTLINIAYIYRYAEKDYAAALKLYQQNLNVLRKRYGEKQTDVAVAYYTIASTYLDMQQADSALWYSQQAIISVHPSFNNTALESQPKTVETMVSDYLIDMLMIKAAAFRLRFEQSQQQKDINHSLEVCQAALSIALQIRDYFRSSEESKLVLQDYLYPTYEMAIETAYMAWEQFQDEKYLELVFTFMEQSKAVQLNQAFHQANANYIAGVPEKVLRKEALLKEKLRKQEEISIEQQLQLKRDYDAFLYELKLHYPAYYELKFGYPEVNLRAIQDELAADQSMISYFVGDSSIFVCQVNRQNIQVYSILQGANLKQLVDALQEGLTAYYALGDVGRTKSLSDYQNLFVQAAHQLFNCLIQPLGQLSGRLLIIPDGDLSFIPFEVLLEGVPERTNHWEYPYLIRSHAINYAYSANLWLAMQQQEKKHFSANWLGIAPVFANATTEGLWRGEHFAPLPYSEEEVRQIQKLTGGEILLHEEADLERFWEAGPRYRCLHLSSHSQYDSIAGERSFVALADTVLFAKDLYARKMPNEMVVLSACATGVGEIKRGEGMFSMARAFTYAGAKSLLMTLWPVKDGTSSPFMEEFYHHLIAGDPKDVALQKAKLHFLEQQEHPYFWAAYILNGNTDAISFGKGMPRVIWALSIGLIALFIFFLKKRTLKK